MPDWILEGDVGGGRLTPGSFSSKKKRFHFSCEILGAGERDDDDEDDLEKMNGK